jgi:hypothetical protein
MNEQRHNIPFDVRIELDVMIHVPFSQSDAEIVVSVSENVEGVQYTRIVNPVVLSQKKKVYLYSRFDAVGCCNDM